MTVRRMSEPSEALPSPRTLVALAMLAVVGTAVGGGIWSALLAANLATTPALPWSVVVMGALLVAAWRWLDGDWGPWAGRATRRRLLRARTLPPRTRGRAGGVGLAAIIALVATWILLVGIAGPRAGTLPDYAAYPPLTVAVALAMSAVLGAVLEESLFRGYFQGSLERIMRGPMAIGVTCLLMTPEHAVTQGFVATTLVFYLAVDGVLGSIAYLTDSILPGIATHAVGLFIFFAIVWPGDQGRVASFASADAVSSLALVAGVAASWALVVITLVRLGSIRGQDRAQVTDDVALSADPASSGPSSG